MKVEIEISGVQIACLMESAIEGGDPVIVFDGRGGEYAATIARMGRSTVDVVVEEINSLIKMLSGFWRGERKRIINEAKEKAKEEANKIVIDAQAAIQTQKMAALTEVKNLVGNLVIEVSEKVLRRELANKSEQEAYIRKLADDVKLN